MKKKLELDGKEWTRLSISVWNDIKKNSEERKLKHPAMFPSELISKLLKMFTHKGDMVLDPFVGSGSTLMSCVEENREGVGLDLNSEYIKLVKKRLKDKKADRNHKVIKEDAKNLLKHVKPNSIDFCVTSPPYWNILNQKRTADYKEKRTYSQSKKDVGNIEEYSEFITSLKDTFSKVYQTLKNGKYCVVVLMDIRKGPKFFPFHIDFSKAMEEIGFELDDMIIWDRRSEYNLLRPLGYPYVFRVNKVHEFVLIFKKPN